MKRTEACQLFRTIIVYWRNNDLWRGDLKRKPDTEICVRVTPLNHNISAYFETEGVATLYNYQSSIFPILQTMCFAMKRHKCRLLLCS